MPHYLLDDSPGFVVAHLMAEFFLGGGITYHNRPKAEMLGVDRQALVQHGAVSAEVAPQMVQRMLKMAGNALAVSIAGIAGSGGGAADVPVGTADGGRAEPYGV